MRIHIVYTEGIGQRKASTHKRQRKGTNVKIGTDVHLQNDGRITRISVVSRAAAAYLQTVSAVVWEEGAPGWEGVTTNPDAVCEALRRAGFKYTESNA